MIDLIPNLYNEHITSNTSGIGDVQSRFVKNAKKKVEHTLNLH